MGYIDGGAQEMIACTFQPKREIDILSAHPHKDRGKHPHLLKNTAPHEQRNIFKKDAVRWACDASAQPCRWIFTAAFLHMCAV